MCKYRSKPLEWEPVEADKLPNPEYCPNAIPEFYDKSKSNSPRSAELKSNVKKHLLFLNWSIEYKPQENCSHKFRYLSPDRQNTYYSLNSLCKAFVESETDTHSPLIQQSESQMEIENVPLIPHDSHTWDLDLSSPFVETCSLTSLLTEPFHEFRDLNMETLTEQPLVQESFLTDAFLTSSFLVEPQVNEYLKTPPTGQFYPIPQEDSPVKTFFPMAQDGNLAILPTGPLIDEKSKSTKSTACQHYQIPQEDSPAKTLSPMTQDANLAILPYGPKSTVCESAEGHEAVVEYLNLGSDAAQRQKGDDKLKNLRTKVKYHLVSVGWILKKILKSNKQELRYISPGDGKSYLSLITACRGYLENYKIYNHIPHKRLPPHHDSSDSSCLTHMTTDDPRPTKKPRPPPTHQDSSYLPPTYPTSDNPRPTEKPPPVAVASPSSLALVTTEVVAVSAPPPLTRRNGRNILGRLIDDDEVAVGDEVYYRGRDGQPMAEGHVTDEGLIKCKCCEVDMNLSSFEAHAGSTNHRPGANIFLKKDERSLQECQLLLKPYQDDKKIKKVIKEHNQDDKKIEKVMKGSNQDDKKIKQVIKGDKKKIKKAEVNNLDHGSKGYKCSICKKFGALIFCYQCPSKFHSRCLGLREVPYGDWFCKACEDEPANEAEFCDQSIVDYLLTGNILPRMDDKNKKLKILRSKAKKHLRSIGWLFFRDETTRQLEYKSPSGKVYFSLMAACEGCIFEDGDETIRS